MDPEQQPLDVIKTAAGNFKDKGERAGQSICRKVRSFFRNLLIAALLFLTGFVGGVYLMRVGGLPAFLMPKSVEEPAGILEIINDETTITNEVVEELLEPASELVTLTYRYRDASSVQDVKRIADFDLPFTLSRAIFTFTGTVKLGLDLSRIEVDVDNEAKVIVLTLPPFDIISSEIDTDSFEFVLEEQNIFNPVEMSTYTEALGELKRAANTRVRNDEEFMAQARANAQTTLEGFLRSSGISSDYAIIFEFRG